MSFTCVLPPHLDSQDGRERRKVEQAEELKTDGASEEEAGLGRFALLWAL